MGKFTDMISKVRWFQPDKPDWDILIEYREIKNKLAIGVMHILGKRYWVKSGPWGMGYMPVGWWYIKKDYYGPEQIKKMSNPAPYTQHGVGYFFPLIADKKKGNKTKRSGFGLHPDGKEKGSVDGSEGCQVQDFETARDVTEFFNMLSTFIDAKKEVKVLIRDGR